MGRPLASDDHQAAFWVGHVRVGVGITLASALTGLVYVAMSWDRPGRPLMAVGLALMLLLTPALLLLPLDAIVRSRASRALFYGWSASVILAVTALAALDDDAESPYGLLYVMVLVYAGTAYPPLGVVGVGVFTLACFGVLSVTSGASAATAVCSAAILAQAVGVCALVARNWWRGEARRRADERRFEAVFRHSTDTVTLLDAEGRVVLASPSALDLVGRQPEELVGSSFLEILSPGDAQELAAGWADFVATPPGSTARVQLRVRSADGTEREVDTVATNMLGDPEVGAVVLCSRDVSERSRLEAELRHRATHDLLTGLPNGARFLEMVAELAGAASTSPLVAVALIDLDDFKDINDSYGHAQGSALLTHVAQRLRQALPSRAVVARLGGDEFALAAPVRSEEEATQLVAHLGAVLRQPTQLDSGQFVVRASIGLIAEPPGRRAVAELLRDADVAMYEAKRQGKARVVVFRTEMQAAVRDRTELERRLRAALDERRLHLAFQPLVDLRSGEVTGVEALCRWDDGHLGPVPPSRFIDVAESTGLIVDLGRWVLAEGCAELRRCAPDLALSVNLSPRQLAAADLVTQVATVLDEAGLAPSQLTLEVTESVLADDDGVTLARLRRLRALGVHLALDDFGTGYASLAYLRRYPFDVLKVDKAFVDDVVTDPEAAAIVSAIVRLAQALGMTTVAEGVETREQADLLRALGCERAQGYHFGRPGPLERVGAAAARS